MSVFNTKAVDLSKQTCFFGEPVNIARYDNPRHPQIEKLTEKQLSLFWRETEVDLGRDGKDFKMLLTPHEQHIFTSNIKRQIILDSVQGRAPSAAFLPICSLPEVETWIQTWAFFETIHSRAYTHVIRNVFSNPADVFDGMLDIKEIVDCATDISKYYDELIDWNTLKSIKDNQKWFSKFLSWAKNDHVYDEYAHKKALWLCMNAVNALEGVRFYVSFACSWAFAEAKRMEGNAKIIKFIARDENTHLAGTQHLLKILPKEDKDFDKIKHETEQVVSGIFTDVVNQEKQWADYLFKDGSTLGLNKEILCEYVDFIAARRLAAIGYGNRPHANPLPWTQKWISGGDVQVAPQETEITSYVIGGISRDVGEDTFKGFEL